MLYYKYLLSRYFFILQIAPILGAFLSKICPKTLKNTRKSKKENI